VIEGHEARAYRVQDEGADGTYDETYDAESLHGSSILKLSPLPVDRGIMDLQKQLDKMASDRAQLQAIEIERRLAEQRWLRVLGDTRC
jgi:hypothetical protein